MIYEFNRFKEPVTSLAQSPVIDVLAIGLADGSIHLLNIREDKILMNFAQDDRVTSISFRTDDQHIMATASNSGDVALWDLEKRRLIHLMKNAHDGFISSLQFINGNPLLITSAADNSIKVLT